MLVDGAADVVGVGFGLEVTPALAELLGPVMGAGAVGLALTGRSIWSEGLAEGVSPAVFEIIVVEAEAEITS